MSQICRLVAIGLIAYLAVIPAVASADSNQSVVTSLVRTGVFLTRHPPPGVVIRPRDESRLHAQVEAATPKGVDEDIAIVNGFSPRTFPSSSAAADSLFNYLQFSGVLVIVSPLGVGVSSDMLTASQERAIERQAMPLCIASRWVDCALLAAVRSIDQVRADKDSAFHDAAVFWAVVLLLVAIAVVVAAFALRWRARRLFASAPSPLHDGTGSGDGTEGL